MGIKPEEIEKYRQRGFTFEEIAQLLGSTKNKLIGIAWRHKNPDRYKHHLKHMNERQVLIVMPALIKRELKALANGKPMSKFCFELLLDGYKYRKANGLIKPPPTQEKN